MTKRFIHCRHKSSELTRQLKYSDAIDVNHETRLHRVVLINHLSALIFLFVQHQTEMELILKYSPFKTEAQFMKEFDKIEGNSGTLVIIYNMKLLDSGEPELDVKTDHFDIMLSNPDTSEFDSDQG